jgi:translocation and assembly module TamB
MLRRILWTIAGLLAVLVLGLGGLLAYAQTRSGKDHIARFLERQLATPERRIELAGLDGFLPFDLRLAELRLSDADGVWLEVDDARLELAPAALLGGAVLIREAGAGRVALHRLPAAAPAPPAEEPFSLPELPELPRSLPRVTLQRLFVDRIELGQPILGEPAAFTLQGDAGTGAEGGRIEASLSLRRTDRPTAELGLEAGLDLATQHLRLDLAGSETGGLLAELTGRPEAGALRLSLRGEGPLSGWQGQLAAEVEHLARAALELELAYAEEKRLGLAGRIEAEPGLLPPEIAQALGSRVDLALTVRETTPQRLAIQQLRLQAADVVLSGTGSVDLAADTAETALTLDLPDLARMGGLARTKLAGSATLRLQGSGPVRQPAWRLELDGEGVAAAGTSVRELAAAFDVAFLAPLGQGDPALRATGRATVMGLAVDGRPIGEDGRATLDLAATLPPAGQATLERLELRSSLAELSAHGTADPKRLAGAFRFDASVPDLASILRALGPPDAAPPEVAGALRLGGDVTLAEGAGRIELTLDGAGNGLRLPPGVRELVGPAPTLNAKVLIEPGTAVTVASLVLAGEAVRLEGDPRYGIADGSLGGTLRLSLPELARLEPVIRQPITGRAELRAPLGGTVTAPALRLEGEAAPLAVAGEAFDRLTLTATAAGEVGTPSGSVRLAAERAGQALTLAGDYRLAGRQLALSGLSLDGPGTRLAGRADVALDGPRVAGGLSGQVQDLAALAPWHRQNLAGGVTLDLQLATPGDRQDARLQLGASRIAGDFGALRSARLDATLRDALGRPALDARLDAEDFARPGLELEAAGLTARGPLADLAVTAQAQGQEAGRPFQLDAAATVAAMGPRRTARLTTLRGRLAGQDLRLLGPATASLDERGVIALDRLGLQIGPAELQASLEFGAGRVRADASLASLPLDLLESFGAPRLSGRVSARLALDGPVRAPTGTAELRVQDLAMDLAAGVKPDAVLQARLGGGRLEASLDVSGLGAQPVLARAAVPITLSLEPFVLALDQGAPLSGSIAGPVDLARVTRLAALDGEQATGILQMALDLGGTVRRPELGGTLDLAGGTFQELRSGIILRDLRLQARGLGRQLAIQTLSARDPTGGRLEGRGNLALLDDGGIRYDASLTARRARVLYNQLGVVLLSGNVDLAGDLAAASVQGALTVERAEIAIPDNTGPAVPVIEVREINGGGSTGAELALQPASPPFDLRLDVAIDIPARLFVRGRGLDSEWQGNLKVSGSAAEPVVVGMLEVRRGHVDLLDRRFMIRRGEISFVGSRPPLPMIAVEATARTADIEIVIKLDGPAAEPRLTLASEPALPQDEVLARLLFGRSVARITPMQGIRLASAVRQLQGGGGVGDALGVLRRAMGVDTLDIQDGETPQETTARAGRYVSDNVYVEVERGVQEGTGKARVQVELTPNLSVGTQVTEQSQTGVGLQWRFDY